MQIICLPHYGTCIFFHLKPNPDNMFCFCYSNRLPMLHVICMTTVLFSDDKKKRKSGNHYMFLSKVILGRSYVARQPENDFTRPPCEEHCPGRKCRHKKIYHSVMGTHRHSTNSTNPTTPLLFREFVIFERCQTYPAYLITYTRK